MEYPAMNVYRLAYVYFEIVNNHTQIPLCHYNDVIMGTMASQITSLTIVFSTVYLDTDQRKHQNIKPYLHLIDILKSCVIWIKFNWEWKHLLGPFSWMRLSDRVLCVVSDEIRTQWFHVTTPDRPVFVRYQLMCYRRVTFQTHFTLQGVP